MRWREVLDSIRIRSRGDASTHAALALDVDPERWRGFENRIQERRLRALTDIIRDSAGAAQQHLDSMQTALDEARQLCPDRRDIAELESMVRAVRPSRAQRRPAVFAAAAAVLAAVVISPLLVWDSRSATAAVTEQRPVVQAGPQPIVAEQGVASDRVAQPAVARVADETMGAPVTSAVAANPASTGVTPTSPPSVDQRSAASAGDRGNVVGTGGVTATPEVAEASVNTVSSSSSSELAAPATASDGSASGSAEDARPSATLAINATPWAEVWIDGRRVGETPIGDLVAPIGQHVIELRHPRFGTKRVAANVTAAEPVRIAVDMTAP